MNNLIVLSYYQAAQLLKHTKSIGKTIQISLDLNLSFQESTITPDGVELSDSELLPWHALQEIVANPNNCFSFTNGVFEKILIFSELTNSTYSLYPTQSAPTMLVSGIPMHRIKDTDPQKDTRQKIKAARPAGRVLDTATGLGYTAIGAAARAEHVITVELDPAAQEICHQNPWSQGLFDNPRIKQRIGDSFDVIETLDDASLNRIIHDPPAFGLAGQLYAGEFYVELLRLLKPGGKLFHYIGNPDSKSGASLTHGVKNRLREVGFKSVVNRKSAFGVLAVR